MKYFLITYILMFSSGETCFSQNSRIADHNTIGWYNYFGTAKLNNKWGLHTEYQWRRDELITNRQQSLLRLGVNYQANSKLQLRVGYANVETYANGEIPINGMGKNFTEHRFFQMATITDKIQKVDVSHRFMLEQRLVGRYSNTSLSKEDEYPLLNRFRYMVRFQIPLIGNSVADKTPYLAVYDEIFLGFGKNVNENIFDQNRLGILLGYRFNKQVRIEGGYLNQTLQLGREVSSRNVFQYNNGFIVNANFNVDFSKKKK